MIKCLFTELGRAGRENIWPSHSVNKYIVRLPGKLYSLQVLDQVDNRLMSVWKDEVSS